MSDTKKNIKSDSPLERITRTVLYEGYSLYPYHRSSAKNVKPVPFGAVYPRAYQKHNKDTYSTSQTQCVVQGAEETTVEIKIRFLHLRTKRLVKINHGRLGKAQFQSADSIRADGQNHRSGWEAAERKINMGTHKIATIIDGEIEKGISFEDEQSQDLIYDDTEDIAGNVLIRQSAIEGNITVSANRIEGGKNGFRITIKITNTTPVENPEGCSRDDVYGLSLLSTNTLLTTEKGVFISQTDPEPTWRNVIDECENINTWPVLIETDDQTMLSSPIVLYDYPEITPESMGDMFDSTEIEEQLMLHMATMTEEERQQIDDNDPKMQAMMERVESATPKEIMKLHGGLREIDSNKLKNEAKE